MNHRFLIRLVLWTVLLMFGFAACARLTAAQEPSLRVEVMDEHSQAPVGSITWGQRHSIVMTAWGRSTITISLPWDSRLRLVGWSGTHRFVGDQLIYEARPGQTVIAIVELPADGCGSGTVAGTIRAFEPTSAERGDDSVVTEDFRYDITPGRACRVYTPLVQGGPIVSEN